MRLPLLLLTLALAGCASTAGPDGAPASTLGTPAGGVTLPAGSYAAAFEASRHVLRDLGFTLDRVDAQLGVITTQPKGTGGVATPWDREQSGLGEAVDDTFNRHRRIVRIEFVPAGAPADQAAGTAAIVDLRSAQTAVELRASVVVERVHHSGWRLNQSSVLNSTYTIDPALADRAMILYAVPVRQDPDLAQRIAGDVLARLGQTRASAAE